MTLYKTLQIASLDPFWPRFPNNGLFKWKSAFYIHRSSILTQIRSLAYMIREEHARRKLVKTLINTEAKLYGSS